MPVVETVFPWVGNCIPSLQDGLCMGRLAEILSDPRLYLEGCVLLIPTSAPKAICSVAALQRIPLLMFCSLWAINAAKIIHVAALGSLSLKRTSSHFSQRGHFGRVRPMLGEHTWAVCVNTGLSLHALDSRAVDKVMLCRF